MKKKILSLVAAAMLVSGVTCGTAGATTIINDSTYGFYNSSIGSLLNGTSGAFPIDYRSGGDPTQNNIPAPNLSAASNVLGDWLTKPYNLNDNWSKNPVAIPYTWPINAETAIIYKFDAGLTGLDNVVAKFGVDNGIYVWLDGTYLNGWMAPGGVSKYEYTEKIGSLDAGTHYLQILREDHGGSDGYAINVTGDAAAVPEPSTMLLLGGGIAGLAFLKRRKNNKA